MVVRPFEEDGYISTSPKNDTLRNFSVGHSVIATQGKQTMSNTRRMGGCWRCIAAKREVPPLQFACASLLSVPAGRLATASKLLYEHPRHGRRRLHWQPSLQDACCGRL